MKTILLTLAVLALGGMAQAATLKQDAACAISRDADIVVENLLRTGDQKAFQILVDSHQAGILNDTAIEVLSSVLDSDYLAIRVVGTLDVYYTFYTNVIGSTQLDGELEFMRSAIEKNAQAQTALYENQIRAGTTPQ